MTTLQRRTVAAAAAAEAAVAAAAAAKLSAVGYIGVNENDLNFTLLVLMATPAQCFDYQTRLGFLPYLEKKSEGV